MNLFLSDKAVTLDITEYCELTSVNIDLSYTYNEDAELEIIVPSSDLSLIEFIRVGMQLVINETETVSEETIIFRGFVVDIKTSNVSVDFVSIVIEATGLEEILSRFLIITNEKLELMTCGYLVNQLVGLINLDGIYAGVIEDGSYFQEYNPFGKSIRNIITDMAEASAFVWWIDKAGLLHFRKDYPVLVGVNSVDSEFIDANSDDTLDLYNISIENSLSDYANQIVVIGGTDVDGNSIATVVDDADEIAYMSQIYGQGVYSMIVNNSSITVQSELDELAIRLLKQHSIKQKTLEFISEKSDYRVGESILVNLPEFDITNDTFMIRDINISLLSDDILIYTITAVLLTETWNNSRSAWVDEFSKFVNKNNLPTNITNTFSNIYNEIAGGTGFKVNVLSLTDSYSIT